MRITNSMIMNNAGGNINGTKVLVDKRNTQMTTQKKIQRPSEDPVIAVRSLRLQTTLNKVNQYYEKNIPDAESWMEVTETALTNIKDIVTNMRTLANRGATETLTQDDRSTILSQMKALQDQVYNEGNADYAGRSVFTGYRTDKNLTFMGDDDNTSYIISEPMDSSAITRKRFYTNTVDVPTNETEINRIGTDNTDIKNMDIKKTEYNVLRLAYDNIDELNSFTFTNDGVDYVTDFDWSTVGSTGSVELMTKMEYSNTEVYRGDEGVAAEKSAALTAKGVTCTTVDNGDGTFSVKANGTADSGYPTDGKLWVFDTEADWAANCKAISGADAPKVVGENEIILIKETGELILGDEMAKRFLTNNDSFKADYFKQGFKGSELRPEYYFDCVQLTDSEGAGVGATGHIFDPTDMSTSVAAAYESFRKYDPQNAKGVVFDKQDDYGNLVRYDINYAVAQNQELTVNLEAGECIDHNIYQDMGDMINAVEWAVAAHDKVDRIQAMIKQDQYADEYTQNNLNKWLEAAQKEADFYDDNLSKLYSSQLGICDSYLEDINLSITMMGCKGDQLAMTKTRMSNQQETVQELQSINDDMDLSSIILKYTAAYTAYQSSLTAAGKLGEQTLLNYI